MVSLLKATAELCVVVVFFPEGDESPEKSEVQAIIESTPELDMDFDGCQGTRYIFRITATLSLNAAVCSFHKRYVIFVKTVTMSCTLG